MNQHEEIYRGSMRRIYRLLPVLAISGTAAVLPWRGWRDALGFLTGAAISFVNFRWLHRLVDSIGSTAKRRSTSGLAWLMGLRYLLFGAVAYAMINYFRIKPVSLLAGLLIVVAAVLLEILYELIYARA